jgi:ABC-2 type transport system permease protein
MWTLTWRSRLTWKRLYQVLSGMLSIPIFSAIVLEPGQQEGFYRIIIDLYFFIVLPILCLNHFGAMIRDELQEDTMTFLITRPVSRSRVFLIKYITHSLWLQLSLLGNGLAFGLVGFYLQVPDVVALISHLIVVQMLAAIAYGALSSLLGLITQKFLVAGVVYGFIVEFGIGQIPTNINVLSISRHMQTLLAQNESLRTLHQWSVEGAPFSLGMVMGGTVLFLTLGALLFTFREYHHTDEMQKGA